MKKLAPLLFVASLSFSCSSCTDTNSITNSQFYSPQSSHELAAQLDLRIREDERLRIIYSDGQHWATVFDENNKIVRQKWISIYDLGEMPRIE